MRDVQGNRDNFTYPFVEISTAKRTFTQKFAANTYSSISPEFT